MADSQARVRLRQELNAHLIELGYSWLRPAKAGAPEIVRISPLRGRIVYGMTVLRSDLERKHCHDRLIAFSQRRTRHRSSILFFIGVEQADQADLEALLERLEIRGSARGGHVHVVPIGTAQKKTRPRAAAASRS